MRSAVCIGLTLSTLVVAGSRRIRSPGPPLNVPLHSRLAGVPALETAHTAGPTELDSGLLRTVPATEARSLRARLAVHASWANTKDRAERTAALRKAALDRFDRQVDPNKELSPEERAARAQHARRAYFTALAL